MGFVSLLKVQQNHHFCCKNSDGMLGNQAVYPGQLFCLLYKADLDLDLVHSNNIFVYQNITVIVMTVRLR
jgi:hypothetical protein